AEPLDPARRCPRRPRRRPAARLLRSLDPVLLGRRIRPDGLGRPPYLLARPAPLPLGPRARPALMKLLLLDQYSELGGAQQVLLELLPALRARGWSATVAIPGDGPMFDRVRALGFETARIDCGPYRSGRK